MSDKYTLIIFGTFILISILFTYLFVTGNWYYFYYLIKMFLRVATPLIIIYLLLRKK